MADKAKPSKSEGKKVDSLVEEISKLSVMELSELVNALQEKLGVTSQPVSQTAGQPAASTTQEAAAPEAAASGGTQTLTMTAAGTNKISVIKALREINQNWGLKEAKDMTEALPVEIIKDGKAEDVKAAADKLKAAGASVELK